MLHYDPGFFQPQGPLASLEGYEYRVQQEAMAQAIHNILTEGHIGIIEAETGVGKSLAYLYPAVCFARTSGEKVVISTNTLNLQDQLLEKDIPILKQLGLRFSAVIVKGWSNYPCQMKIDVLLEGVDDSAENNLLEDLDYSLKQGLNQAQKLFNELPADLRERVEAESDLCLRAKCAYFSTCPVFVNRRQAEGADLLIVNHHLLLADVHIRQQTGWDNAAVLPPYQHVIFDEAHHLEDIATEYFGLRVSLYRIRRLLGCFLRPYPRDSGILQQLRKNLMTQGGQDNQEELCVLIDWKLMPQIRIIDDAAGKFFQALEDHLQEAKSQDHLLIGHSSQLETSRILESYDKLHTALGVFEQNLKEFGNLLGEESEDKERLIPFSRRVEGLKIDLEFLMEAKSKEYVYWLKAQPKAAGVVLQAAPIQVGQEISERLLYPLNTAIFTSATLCVQQDFSYFRSGIGINNTSEWDLCEKIYSSPFDYHQQVYLGVVKDLPLPEAAEFPKTLADSLQDVLGLTDGKAFILFTSYKMMHETHAEIKKLGLDEKYIFLVQGEMPRMQMVDRFKAENKTVLLGTDSFWEGVDVAGEALSMVIIAKLPFRVPTDPVAAVRSDYLREEGKNPFVEYHLPQAVLKFRQGCGRLIRTRSDKGVIIICDRRIMERGYGSRFLDSLPSNIPRYKPLKEIVAAVKTWI